MDFMLQGHGTQWTECEHFCDNCGRVWRTKDLKHTFPDIPDMTERLEPGNEIPSGECPHCGALTYVDRTKAVVSTRLRDVMRGDGKGRGQKIELHITMEGVAIKAERYGDYCSTKGSGTPALLELADGELRLAVWSDINKEDTTHIIGLEEAKEKHRVEDK
jgi:hypothetical protein